MNRFCRFEGTATYVVTILAIATAYFLLSRWTPLLQDDLVFQAQSLDPHNPSAGFSLQGWLRHIATQWIENNGRLANILAPLGSMVFPRWCRALITAASVSAIFILLGNLSRSAHKEHTGNQAADAAAMTSIWLASMLCWPWRDRIMLWDYALNYATSMAAILLFIFLLTHFCRHKKAQSATILLAAIPVAIIAGWMHDGISVPLAGALGILALIRRMRLTPRWWLLTAAFAAGTAISLSAPGEWSRAETEIGATSMANNLRMLLKSAPLVPLMPVVAAMAIIRPQLRRKLPLLMESDTFIIAVAFVALSTAMNLALDITPRYNWATDIMAALALWKGARTCISGQHKLRCIATAWSCLLFTMVPICAALHAQHALWQESNDIEAEIARSPHGTVFRDIIMPEHISPLALRQTTAGIWGNQFHMACYNGHGMAGNRMAAVVPAALHDFTFREATPLKGNADIYLWRGHMVSADTIAPFPPEQGFPSGRQRSAVRNLCLHSAAGQDTTITAGIFKFNLATGTCPTAVYWGTAPATPAGDTFTHADL